MADFIPWVMVLLEARGACENKIGIRPTDG